MFAEISLLQYFGVFLGHPIYAMSVCLFSLILSAGLGSLASDHVPLNTAPRITVVGGAGLGLSVRRPGRAARHLRGDVIRWSDGAHRGVAGRVDAGGIPDGVCLPHRNENGDAISREPAAWFWGINGATGVLASTLAVMIAIAMGINVTMMLAGVCYLLLIPAALALLRRAPN